jgi:tetratricopeptide (TPR) repeat protein
LSLKDSLDDSPERTFALFVAGQYSNRLGLRSEAIRDLHDSLTLAQRLDLLAYEAMATNSLAAVMHEVGDTTGALVYAKRAVELARQAGNDREVTRALANFAMHLRGLHQLEEAKAVLEEVLVRSRGAGRRTVTAVVLLNLAMVTLDLHKPEQTSEALAELVPSLQSLQSPMLTACLVDVVAALLSSRGDQGAADRLWVEADRLYNACSVQRDGPDAAFMRRWRRPPTTDNAHTLSSYPNAPLGMNALSASALDLATAFLKGHQG